MKRIAILINALCLAAALGAQVPEDWFWGKTIEQVQWEGVVNADRKQLDSVARPYLGKAFTDELWIELQARLYELEWFESIMPEALPANEERSALIVRFSVTEKPAVGAVRVAGNSGVRTNEIVDVVLTKPGDIYNAAKARLDELAVRRLYVEKGYPRATVSSVSVKSSEPSRVDLVFTVNEGAQVAVRELRFSGATVFSPQTLKGQLSLKEAGLFQSGVFQEAKLEEDKDAIRDYYRSRGYADAAVLDVLREYSSDERSGKESLILTFVVGEGRLWTYEGIEFAGNRVFDSAKLASFVSQKPGQVLNYQRLLRDKQRIDDLYYENGYIFNAIELEARRDEEKGSIFFTVSIVERDRAHIESISFKGNVKTKEYVLAREIPLEVGDVFSKAKIVEGLRSLYNLQYFSAIEPEMMPGSADNLMDLVINVEEQSTADIQFGVTLSGFGQEDTFPVSGTLKWNDRNFLGNGQTFGVEMEASPDTQTLTFGFEDKWLFGRRLSGGVNLSFSHATETTGIDMAAPIFEDGVPDPFSSLEEYEAAGSAIPDAYKMQYEAWDFTLGFSTGYSFRTRVGDLGLVLGLSTTLGQDSYDAGRYRPASQALREANGEWGLGNKISLRGYLNRLDLWYNPSRGYYASQKLGLAGFFAGETEDYLRSDTRIEGYVTLFDLSVLEGWNLKWVLGAHSSFSHYFAKRSDPGLLVSSANALRVDGTFVGRGWSSAYSKIGVGLWENWLELRMPLFAQFLWLDGFLDAAALKTSGGLLDFSGDTVTADASKEGFSSLGWENMAFSLGFGFRFTIPQFPFRFYFVKRFSSDGSGLDWKSGPSGGMDFVISISQPLN